MENSKNILTLIILLIGSVSMANSIQLEFENDIIANSDRYYTHGTRLTYEYDDLNWFLQQNIYTPSDISIQTPMTNDRPYAGMLCVGIRGTKPWTDPRAGNGRQNIYHQLEVSVGAVGQYSGAKNAQTVVHEWVGSRQPMGWDYQTDDMIWLHTSLKIYGELLTTKYLNSRVYLLGDLGTVISDAGGGCQVIVGYNVPHALDKPMISTVNTLSLYMYGDCSYRNIVYNKLLESDYTDITPVNSVVDIKVGVGIRYNRVSAQYGITKRSKEFSEQEYAPRFGTISVSIEI